MSEHDNDYGWEVTIDTSQSSYNPRMKVRDGHVPRKDQMNDVIEAFEYLRGTMIARGWKIHDNVAPIK